MTCSLTAQDIIAIRVGAKSNDLSSTVVDISQSLTDGIEYRVYSTLRFTNLAATVRWTNQILLYTNVLHVFTADSFLKSNDEITVVSSNSFIATNLNKWAINPTSTYISAHGGTGTISVSSLYDLLRLNVNVGNTVSETNAGNNSVSNKLGVSAWTAIVDTAWITIVSGNHSNANGTVTYIVATNFGDKRIGHVIIAGKTNTVTQSAPPRTINDFDGDRCSDMTIYDHQTGSWYIWSPAKNAVLAWNAKWGYWGTEPVPGDYDGDWCADLAVYDPQTGSWFIWSLNKMTIIAWNLKYGYWGGQPVAGDYDGDGWSDLAVYDPKTTKWYINSSKTHANLVWNFKWGITNAEPVPGDYDGDGRTDLATYDPQTSTWDVWSVATKTTVVSKLKWGYWGAEAVPADYNGDEITDKAIYDAAIGSWKISFSTGGGGSGSEIVVAWGYKGSQAAPGDYDGDDRTDLATYDNSGNWYIYSLSNSVLAWKKPWGFPGAVVSRNNADNPPIDKWTLTIADESVTFGITGLVVKENKKYLIIPPVSTRKYILGPGWYVLKTDYYGETTVWSNGLVNYKASGTLTNRFRVAFPDTRTFSMTGGVFATPPTTYSRPVMKLK